MGYHLPRYLAIGLASGLLGGLGEWAGLPNELIVLMVILTGSIGGVALFSRPES